MCSSVELIEVGHPEAKKDSYLNIKKQVTDFVFENRRAQFVDLVNLTVPPESCK